MTMQEELSSTRRNAMLYWFMIVLSALSIRMTWLGLQNRSLQNESMFMGLALQTTILIDSRQYEDTIKDMKVDKQEEINASTKSHSYWNQAIDESVQAKKYQNFSHGAEMESMELHNKAASVWELYNHTDEERLAILQELQNAQKLQKEEQEQQQEETHYRQGLCSWRFFSIFCHSVGGVMDLSTNEDESLAIQIHTNMQRLDEIKQHELMLQVAATALDEQAAKDDKLSQELHKTAEQWMEYSKRDSQLARQWNQTALELDKKVQEEQKAAVTLHETAEQLSKTQEDLLQQAMKAQDKSQQYLKIAIWLAILPFVYFVMRVVNFFVGTNDSVFSK